MARIKLARLQVPTSRVVDVQCGSNGEGIEFAVEAQKTTDGAAGASGWEATGLDDVQHRVHDGAQVIPLLSAALARRV